MSNVIAFRNNAPTSTFSRSASARLDTGAPGALRQCIAAPPVLVAVWHRRPNGRLECRWTSAAAARLDESSSQPASSRGHLPPALAGPSRREAVICAIGRPDRT